MWWAKVNPEPKRILLLAGTMEARELAMRLADWPNLFVVASLAGAVSRPAVLPVTTRTGGFGGVDGLVGFLRNEKIDVLLDVTHPFAAQMKAHVDQASMVAGIKVAHVIRPAWIAEKADTWLCVRSLEEAVSSLPANCRPFLSIGRREIGLFTGRPDIHPVARMIDPPDETSRSDSVTILLSHPQAHEAAERELFVKHAITHLVTKNSGGSKSRAKILAARSLSIPVIMVDRPPPPAALILETIEAAETWLRSVLDN